MTILLTGNVNFNDNFDLGTVSGTYTTVTTTVFSTNGTVTYPPTTATSTMAPVSSDFGKVSKCTLSGLPETITVNGRTYCVVKKGKMIRADADQSCKSENARLPLPKNDDEVKAFRQFSKASTWIDLSVSGRVQNNFNIS